MSTSLEEYVAQHCSAEPDYLREIERDSFVHCVNPRMVAGKVNGRILAALSKMICPQHVLEIGTFTGYSALCWAEGLRDDGEIITIEHNDELETRIRRNLARSILGGKITLLIDDALRILPTLKNRFDIVYLDADKCEYLAYYEALFANDLVQAGSWIFADNTLWDGHVVDNDYDKDKQTVSLRAFNDYVVGDERVETVILPLLDGLSCIKIK